MINNKKLSRQQIFIASIIILVFFIAILSGYFSYINIIEERVVSILNEAGPEPMSKCEAFRRLDGMCMPDYEDNLWPIALMIDNHPDTWPQYGLSKAQLVYNTLVEGSNTRLMAVYTTAESIRKIGPVRSARPYYLPWAKEINALYGHSGGSPESIEKIKEYKVIDLEEATWYGHLYFWRNQNELEPHNLFTSNERLEAARIDWELFDKEPNYHAWQFDEFANSTTEDIEYVHINYSPGITFDVEYKYDEDSKTYLRFQADDPHLDALTNKQIKVKNLIIQFVPTEEHLDAEDRLAIDVTGIGEAWVLYDGKMIKGQWAKKEIINRTWFANKDGNEIIFKPGNIWVEVVPVSREVTIQE